MRTLRFLFIIGCFLVFILFSFSIGLSDVILSHYPPGSTTYNRFLAGDLGFTKGGKNNRVFSITFDSPGTTTLYHLHIEISSEGKTILSGNTGSHAFNSKYGVKQTYWNYEILDELGGSFTVSRSGSDVRDKVLKTGEVPQGTYIVQIQLVRESDQLAISTEQITFTVVPASLHSIYPVNTSVTKSSMDFKWFSKELFDMQFHLFKDPGGRDEIRSGYRLPRSVGSGQGYDGSGIGSLLNDGSMYYWQIRGKITTTHGDELVKSPLNAFLYFEDKTSLEDWWLDPVVSREITEELSELLKEYLSKRVIDALKDYDIERITLDNGGIFSKEQVLSILAMIKNKEVEVKSVYFK